MRSHRLTGIDSVVLTQPDIGGVGAARPWSIKKEVLRGGKREGVEAVTVDNGALSFTVLPTRGMGLWQAQRGDDRVGWDSPVKGGPVHPAYVDLTARGGLGWLSGFDELLARCGLASNGPPVFDAQGRFLHGLHGRIANTPADDVEVSSEVGAAGAIAVDGHVFETELFFTQLELATRYTTVPGSNTLSLRDYVINAHDVPAEFQLLYHWNFGPPYLEEGARFVAPVKTVCPPNTYSADGIGHYDVYGPPRFGFPEQVYFFALHANGDGATAVMLRNRAGDKGVALRFNIRELPCFTLWKCTQGLREGYVTGLEPGVNFPNTREFEQARGRVPRIEPGGRREFHVSLSVLSGLGEVSAVEAEIQALQKLGAPEVLAGPAEPFAPTA